MGDRPDVQAHQFERRTLGRGDLTAECGCRVLYHIESALGRGQRLDLSARNRTGLEHHGITCRLLTGEGEIGLAEVVEGGERRGQAIVPRHVEPRGKALKAVFGDLSKKRVAVAKMPVGRCRADSGKPRGLSQAEAEGTMLLDQLASGLYQYLFAVAVMI